MSGKHLCQSRLSAAYISSNRYMHIILFYFRLFILFSPGLPFTLTSLVLHPAFIGLHPAFFVLHPVLLRSSSSFPHPSSGLVPAFLHLSSPFIRPSLSPFPLFSLCFLSVIPVLFLIISFALSPSFQLSSPSFPARPGIPVLSTVLPLVFPTGFSPSFPMFTLSTIPFAPPVIRSSRPRHSRLDRESLAILNQSSLSS